MLQKAAISLVLMLIAGAPLAGQPSRPGPLPRLAPSTSDLGQANRELDALGQAGNVVARLFVRFDQAGDVTTAFRKYRPEGFRINAESGKVKWKNVANGLKPSRTEGQPGYFLVAADWNASNQKKKARCISDLTPGFHEVVFLRGTDTSDKEQDNFICRISFLPLPAEDLEAWIAALPVEAIEAFNSCAEASSNTVDQSFWTCAAGAGIPLPPLSQEVAKRMEKGAGG